MRNPEVKASFAVLIAAAFALSGCGYRPLYGSSAEDRGVSASLASVSIPEPTSRAGQIVRNDLLSAMRGNAAEERYTLTLEPNVKKSAVIDLPQPAVTRQSITLTVAYELLDRRTGGSLQRGKTFSQVSFDVIRQPFADQQAETNATERAAHEVSGDIRTRIAAYFSANLPQP
jgi:LPS-assembly lipoprotein